MTITDAMHSAIAGARLQGEARVVSFAEKTRRAILARNGVQPLSYDQPREVVLPQDTSASYWVEEIRPGLVCRVLSLSSRPAARQPCALADADLGAVLMDYGFKHTLEQIAASGGVTRASSPSEAAQQGTIITVIEPIHGDLIALRGSTPQGTTLLDPATIPVAVVSAGSFPLSSVDRDIANAIDGIDLGETA